MENDSSTGQLDKHTVYYVNAFKKIDSGENIVWNFAAFLFSFLWMFMRGMYWQGFCVLSVLMLCQLTGHTPYVAVAISVALGFYGTKIYYEHIKRLIDEGWHLCDCYESKNYVVAGIISCIFIADNDET
jgi:hypothetical protein